VGGGGGGGVGGWVLGGGVGRCVGGGWREMHIRRYRARVADNERKSERECEIRCVCAYMYIRILSCMLPCICEFTVAENAQNARPQRGWDQVHICSDMSMCICLETYVYMFRNVY